MSAVFAPQGFAPISHPSGEVRIDQMVDGILSGYGTSIFTNTPVKRNTDGTLIPTGVAAADPTIGVFMGVEFTSVGRRFILPYWPAGQTYDVGSCLVSFTSDRDILYEVQDVGSVALINNGEGVNVNETSQGSLYTGQSTQSASAPTGATAATFTIRNFAPYPNNAWGDAFTIIRVAIQTYQGPVA